MEEFIKLLIGDYSIAAWLAYFFFSLLGVIAFSWAEVSDRDKKSVQTPFKFTWKFFLLDNIKRYVATAIFIYIQFKFFKQLTGSDLSEYSAFLIGFGSDGMAGFGKRNTKILQADRDKLLKDNTQ